MPRVTTATKSSRGTKVYRCTGCGSAIEAGEQYYSWKRRTTGWQHRHVKCGYPRPSQLSGRKTAVVEDAIQDAENELQSWTPELDDDLTYSDGYGTVETILEGVAEQANEVADEYESGADNMPESLQYGSQAEAMRDVAERLREWAQELSDFTPDSDEPDLPERETFLGSTAALQDKTAEEQKENEDVEYREACETALSDWADEVRSNASDKMQDLPEYEG